MASNSFALINGNESPQRQTSNSLTANACAAELSHDPTACHALALSNRTAMSRGHMTSKTIASSIGRHLFESKHQIDYNQAFTIVYRSTNPRLLRFAEAVAIHRENPILFVQKRLQQSLQLPWS